MFVMYLIYYEENEFILCYLYIFKKYSHNTPICNYANGYKPGFQCKVQFFMSDFQVFHSFHVTIVNNLSMFFFFIFREFFLFFGHFC